MSLIPWFLIVGVLLVTMALASSFVRRLPLTSAMFYLGVGILLGPAAAGLLALDVVDDAAVVEHVAEIAVIVSLFTAGLKLRLPFSDGRWRPPAMLALVAMALTVGAVAFVAAVWLDVPLGAAVLLGAILAPTDPVLASDVQVEHARDPERLRFSLTGEAGLNDGTAFPFVMLGLGLLGLHEIGTWGWRWWLVDLAWAAPAGLATGVVCGTAIGRLVVHMRRVQRETVGLDDFIALGLIAVAYGVALLIAAYGFLAVFAAGVALRRIERQHSETLAPRQRAGGGTRPEGSGPEAHAPAEEDDPLAVAPVRMAEDVQGFNERLERLGEVAAVVLVGAMLSNVSWRRELLWFVPLLFLVVRPAAVFISLAGSRPSVLQRAFIGWFGVRGVGSIYYLAYCVRHGVEGDAARLLADVTLATVTVSIVAHGVSVTPLMKWYEARRR